MHIIVIGDVYHAIVMSDHVRLPNLYEMKYKMIAEDICYNMQQLHILPLLPIWICAFIHVQGEWRTTQSTVIISSRICMVLCFPSPTNKIVSMHDVLKILKLAFCSISSIHLLLCFAVQKNISWSANKQKYRMNLTMNSHWWDCDTLLDKRLEWSFNKYYVFEIKFRQLVKNGL